MAIAGLPSWLAAEERYETAGARHRVMQKNVLHLASLLERVRLGGGANKGGSMVDRALSCVSAPVRLLGMFVCVLFANYLLKDPYIFDLAGAKEKADERDIEEQLVKHVTRYLLEMGNGFAFVARQKHFQVGNSDFFADLILYSIPLHAYIVIELKATPFKPEYAGQLNFYINVVDDKLRGEHDNKTIGLLLCRGKDEVVAQYALSGYDQPIGISDYQLSKAIPEKLKSALPSVEEVEEELASFLDKDPQ